MCIFSKDSLSYNDNKIYDFIFRLYNREAKKYKWHPALKMTNARRMILAKYINVYTLNDVFIILREFRKAKNFITGASWLNIDWLLKEDNFIKVMEGKYRDKYTTTIVSEARYTERKY